MNLYLAGFLLVVGFAVGSFLMSYLNWRATKHNTEAIKELADTTNGNGTPKPHVDIAIVTPPIPTDIEREDREE